MAILRQIFTSRDEDRVLVCLLFSSLSSINQNKYLIKICRQRTYHHSTSKWCHMKIDIFFCMKRWNKPSFSPSILCDISSLCTPEPPPPPCLSSPPLRLFQKKIKNQIIFCEIGYGAGEVVAGREKIPLQERCSELDQRDVSWRRR